MLKRILTLSILAICVYLNPPLSQAEEKYILEGPVYLAVNIHYQDSVRGIKASYANYTDSGAGHGILAVNTPVQIKKGRRSGFIIVDDETNKEIVFEYNKDRMHMSINECLEKITLPVKVDLRSLSELDRKGIKEGVAKLGMSKKGIMMALGYPAAHKTPSLEDNRWIYWKDRIRTLIITFSDKGVVSHIRG